MEKTATFTISRDGRLYNIKSKSFNTYNRVGITVVELFNEMEHLADVFNNVIGIGVVFEIG